jgi:membrane protein YqaA with SNARE-associated domain
MPVFGWPELWALLTSVGFGTVSAVVPVVNAEAYVVGSQVSAIAGAVPIAVGVGIGQTFGKLILFLSVRQGKNLPFIRHRRAAARRAAVGPFRARMRAVIARLLELVGQKRWGLPIVLLAAVVGLPPLYAVALLAGATTMRTLWFTLVVLVGRVARFVLLALGVGGLHHLIL